MLIPSAVTIVVNGTIVPSFTPARIVAGRVVAPLSPIVVRLASRTAYDRSGGTVTIERDGVRIVVAVVYVENGQPYVELGPVVRAIGGTAAFDSAAKTLTIAMNSGGPIATPAPFDPAAPRVSPTTVFTPRPPAPTPRGAETGLPRPRRTPIPVLPSQPESTETDPAAASPTDPRR
jgi:hypothetical protein